MFKFKVIYKLNIYLQTLLYMRKDNKITNDKFKMNFFSDEHGPTFEEKVIEIIEKYNEKNYGSK